MSVFVAAALIATGAASVAWAVPGAGPSTPAPDEDLNNRGVDLRRAGRDQEALDVFQQAYDLTHSPRATAQLGVVYQALGRWELAAPLVEKALQTPNDPWIKKYLAPLKEALDLIKSHLAWIDIAGDPPGAEVIVNGSLAGRLPLAGPLTIVKGTVDVQVRAPGFRDEARKLTLEAYQHERIFIRLDKLPTSATAMGASPGTTTEMAAQTPVGAGADTDHPGVSTRAVMKWTALGLALAGLATGTVASVIHEQKTTDFATADNGGCRDMNGRAVDVNTGNPVAACQSALDAYQSARTWQIAGFTVGGALAVAWLVLQLTEPSPVAAPRSSAAAWSCAPSLAHAGALCAMRF